MKTLKVFALAAIGVFFFGGALAASTLNMTERPGSDPKSAYPTERTEITRDMIVKAQEKWIAALVSVGAAV